MPLRYSAPFMQRVARYASRRGQHQAAEKFGVALSSAHNWLHNHGLKPRPIGAPKGNLNALGGRILNTSRPL
jgi:hypothetical protein